uniref:Uncharacterized protein n=1 Tax=Anopheles albimanus TaxID=7167 RepID=A0A182FW88_ANOAL
MAPIVLKGKNYALLVGGIVGIIALACYPIIVHPMMHPEEYKKVQKINRAGIKQEDIQPGSKPFWWSREYKELG